MNTYKIEITQNNVIGYINSEKKIEKGISSFYLTESERNDFSKKGFSNAIINTAIRRLNKNPLISCLKEINSLRLKDIEGVKILSKEIYKQESVVFGFMDDVFAAKDNYFDVKLSDNSKVKVCEREFYKSPYIGVELADGKIKITVVNNSLRLFSAFVESIEDAINQIKENFFVCENGVLIKKI